jgi:seryl-tRNA synthetase
VDRARKGDFEARKALGLVAPEELHKRNSEWEAVPPEVRQLYEERNKAHEELQALRAEKEQREVEVARRREETELGQARRMALDTTHSLLDTLGVTEDNAERYLPHVAGAIADLADYGLELGVDMTPDLIAERVKQRIGGMDEQHFSSLSPKRAVALMESHLSKMDDTALLDTVSDKLARRISKAYAQRVTGQRRQAAPQQQTMQREVERRPEPPQVLSPFRFKR